MPSYCRTEVGYRAAVSRKLVISLSLIFLAIVLTLVNLAVGVAHIGLSEVLKTLIFPNDVEPLVETVVWTMRLPVALAAVVVSLLAAASVCFVGTIGFVGLAGPHIGRFFSGDDQRFFFPISALCGALVMSLASLISKSIIPGSVFPIGIVTSIIGVPFFFMLVAYRQRGYR